jgi:hypothetical protein
MTTSYTSLEHFRAAKHRSREDRDAHALLLQERWAMLKKPETRGILLRDAMGDALRTWQPYRRMRTLLGGSVSGSTVSSVAMTIASLQGGLGKRMLFSGIGMLLGKVIGDPEGAAPGMLSTLATAIGRMRRRMRERKVQREEAKVEAPT